MTTRATMTTASLVVATALLAAACEMPDEAAFEGEILLGEKEVRDPDPVESIGPQELILGDPIFYAQTGFASDPIRPVMLGAGTYDHAALIAQGMAFTIRSVQVPRGFKVEGFVG